MSVVRKYEMHVGEGDATVVYPAELQVTMFGWRLRFGKGGCVIFDVYYPHEHIEEVDRDEVLKELATAQLTGVSYNDDCITSGRMERGDGTVAMLVSAIRMLKVLFPAVTGATFKDTSRVDCESRTSVSLKHSSLARHSKTWYMRHFNALPGQNRIKDVLQDIEKGRSAMDESPLETYDEFYDREIFDANDRPKVKNFKEAMMKYYEGYSYLDTDSSQQVTVTVHRVKSYREFVKRLNDIDCVMIETWIGRFIDKRFGSAATGDFNWRIDVPVILSNQASSFKIKDLSDGAESVLPVILKGGGGPNSKILLKDRCGRRLPEAIHMN